MFSTQNLKAVQILDNSMKEQAISAKEIVASSQELLQTSEYIKISMVEQKNGTDEFKTSMVSLRDMLFKTRESIDEHIRHFEAVIGDITHLNEMSQINRNMGDRLNGMISKFKVTEKSPKIEISAEDETETGIKLVE